MLVDPSRYQPHNVATDKAITMSTPSLSAGNFGDQIKSVLDADEISDGEKVKRYLSIISRHKGMLESGSRFDSSTAEDNESNFDDDLIISSLPLNVQYKGRRLLQHINANSIQMSWNKKNGELIYKQSVLPGTNIIDLLTDVLTIQSKAEGPLGWQEFALGLKNSGGNKKVSKDLIPNFKRWKFIQTADDSVKPNTPESVSFESPYSKPVTAQRKTRQQQQQRWLEEEAEQFDTPPLLPLPPSPLHSKSSRKKKKNKKRHIGSSGSVGSTSKTNSKRQKQKSSTETSPLESLNWSQYEEDEQEDL